MRPGEYHLILLTSVATARICPHPFELRDRENYVEESSVCPMGFVENVGKLCACIVWVLGLIKSDLATAASSGGRVGSTQSRIADKLGNIRVHFHCKVGAALYCWTCTMCC